MKKLRKIVFLAVLGCLFVLPAGIMSAAPKILSVDIQRVFENYENAKAAQAAFKEATESANKELKEMYDSLMKLQEEIAALAEKSENTSLVESAREKYKKEAEEKTETLRAKEGEFIQFRQDVNKKFAARSNKELMEHEKAVLEVVSAVAKSKKAEIVLNKVPGTLYVDDSLDITQLIIEKLNSSKK